MSDPQRLAALIGSNIQKISHNVAAIKRAVDQIGTSADTDGLREKLHELTQNTKGLAQDTSRLLKELADAQAGVASVDQQRQFKLQRERLTNDFSAVLNDFQGAQRDAARKEKESVLRARANSGIAGNPFADDTPFNEPVRAAEGRSQLALEIEKDIDAQELQEREEAIKQLESDILGVNQIFKDLALMVHEQGEVVDSIEANVESAEVQVTSASRDIAKARELQRSVRKKRVFCIVLAIVVVVILAIVIYFTTKK